MKMKRFAKLLTLSFLCVFLATLAFSVSFAVSKNPLAIAATASYLEIKDTRELKDISGAQISTIVFVSKSDNDEFNLPSTYFLKVTRDKYKLPFSTIECYDVEFNGLAGVVLAESFDSAPAQSVAVDLHGEAPVLTLTYNSATPTNVKNNAVDNSWTLYYMGVGAADSTKIYTKCVKGETTVYGLIPKSSVAAYIVPAHQVTIDKIAALNNNNNGSDGSVKPQLNPNDVAIKTVLIIGIVVPAVLIMVLLFKPRKRADGYDNYSRRTVKSRSEYDSPYRQSRYDRGYDRNDRYEGDDGRFDRYDDRSRRGRDEDYYPKDY